MKRLAELTVEDLIASPVWRYEGGAGSEALVAPSKRETLSQYDDEIFLAATEFALADASRHMIAVTLANTKGFVALSASSAPRASRNVSRRAA